MTALAEGTLPGQLYYMATINLAPKVTFVYDWVGRANGFMNQL